MKAPAPLARIYALILLTTVFWGGTAVAGKLVIDSIPPLTAGVMRYGGSALVLAALFRRRLPDVAALARRDVFLLVAVGVLGSFLNHILFFFGLMWAPAAHGSIVPATTSPMWTMLLAAWLGGERVSRGQIAGVALCLAGVLLVVRPERLLEGRGVGVIFGDVLFVLGGLSWAVYSVLSKMAMRHVSASGTLAFGMAVGTTGLAPLSLVERPWSTLPRASAVSWIALAYLVVAGTVLSFLWWNIAIRRVGAARTAIFSNLVPVFGVLLAWLVLGERLTPIQLAGGCLALLGVLVCQDFRPGGDRRKPGPSA